MSIQVIPLNLLTVAPENVRKTDVGPDDTLVASIRAQGLLQNLVVRPNVAAKGKTKGQPAGTYAVVAGGRRLQSLNILAEEGHLPTDFGVPCAIHLDDSAAVSLAENFARKAMAPLDELDAFTALVDQGRTEDEVARQYGVQVLHVRQRLKLARVSPVIREAFRGGRLNLDTLKAYTLTDDHEAQEAIWAAGWGNDAYSVRTRLTERKLNANHRTVQFVGLPAYEAAGGKVLRDLFGLAPACIEDAGLIERLAQEKLQAHAEALKAEGWAWIDPVSQIDWGLARHCEKLIAAGPGLTEAEQDEAEALSLELEGLDEGNDGTAARGDEIEVRLAALDAKAAAAAWSPEQMAKAGGWITIGYAGEIAAELGYVRRKPDTEAEGSDEDVDGERAVRPSSSHQPARDEPAAPGHSWALVEDMSAHLTAGLQAELVERPDIAYLVLLHALALDLFYPCSQDRSVGIRTHQNRAEWHGATTKECTAVEHINGRYGSMALRLPKEARDLWPYLVAADDAARAEILAVCVASSLTAVQKATDRGDALRESRRRLGSARHIAGVVGLDMAKWWRPTAATYLGSVSKDTILDALAEAGQVKPGEKLGAAKKADLVVLAEDRLTPTTWLPAFLRVKPAGEAQTVSDGAVGSDEVLAAE